MWKQTVFVCGLVLLLGQLCVADEEIDAEYDKHCICTRNFLPVCGSDKRIYGNPCVLDCERYEKVKRGESPIEIRDMDYCEKNDDVIDSEFAKHCECTRDMRPVCGSDQKIYINPCELDCENYKRSKRGEPSIELRDMEYCTKKGEIDRKYAQHCKCTRNFSPVCGSDKRIYGNPCELDCERYKQEKRGESPIEIRDMDYCEKNDDVIDSEFAKHCGCTREMRRVCGSDKKIYNNPCELDCENYKRSKKGEPSIELRDMEYCAKEGEIDREYAKHCICTRNLLPVCGSDKQIYGNPCVLECESYKQIKRGGSPIEKRDMDYCEDAGSSIDEEYANRCRCSREMARVCGSDGQMYNNPCVLDCESYKRERRGESPIVVSDMDNCKQEDVAIDLKELSNRCTCTRILRPTCGSDKQIYANPCVLDCENFKHMLRGESPIEKRDMEFCKK